MGRGHGFRVARCVGEGTRDTQHATGDVTGGAAGAANIPSADARTRTSPMSQIPRAGRPPRLLVPLLAALLAATALAGCSGTNRLREIDLQGRTVAVVAAIPPHPRVQRDGRDDGDGAPLRSEEHTSELQSREKIVCRLLLEKK